MFAVTKFAVLGGHQVEREGSMSILGSDSRDERSLDAIDVLLYTDDAQVLVFGLRTRSYLSSPFDPNRMWGNYSPISVTLDFAAVKHWDFNEVLWLGPSVWPCVAWSNADSFNLRLLSVCFAPSAGNNLLAGPAQRGLPSPADIGLAPTDNVHLLLIDPPSQWVSR